MDDDAEPGRDEQDRAEEPDEAGATDAAEPAEAWERPIDRFRRGAAGSVIAAGLLGVRDAL